MRRFIALILLSLTGATPATSPTAQPLHLTFTQPNPLSDLKEWVRREGGTIDQLKKAGATYNLADESFEAYIPPGCDDAHPYGLLVWIPPGKTSWPADWLDTLDQHKLIWVSPNNAANQRNALIRVALALDAVHNMKQRYPVDPNRIYVSGFSGGGRAASIAAVGFPDVFTGGLPMMGVNFYRQLPAGAGKAYPRGSFRPPGLLFTQLKLHPLVLLTAEHDMNRDQIKTDFAAFQHDGFKHVSYLEVPNLGHEMPPVEWLNQALDELDKTPATTHPTKKP